MGGEIPAERRDALLPGERLRLLGLLSQVSVLESGDTYMKYSLPFVYFSLGRVLIPPIPCWWWWG